VPAPAVAVGRVVALRPGDEAAILEAERALLHDSITIGRRARADGVCKRVAVPHEPGPLGESRVLAGHARAEEPRLDPAAEGVVRVLGTPAVG
jgi:hypothetical protein